MQRQHEGGEACAAVDFEDVKATIAVELVSLQLREMMENGFQWKDTRAANGRGGVSVGGFGIEPRIA